VERSDNLGWRIGGLDLNLGQRIGTSGVEIKTADAPQPVARPSTTW
jgi:hypothetical protein